MIVTDPLPTVRTLLPRNACCPIGTVVVRPNKTRSRKFHREIKVKAKGPREWMAYARWWWLKHKGPIPDGLRVLHRDGDTMNDDPANLVLGTAADQAFINHDTDPEMSAENFRKMRVATAEHNRLRSRVRRAIGWLPSRFYPVDHAARQIHNAPCKTRWQVYAAVGMTMENLPRNGRGVIPRALGWPGLSLSGVLILLALEQHRERGLNGAELREALTEARRDLGLGPIQVGAYYTLMCGLKRLGFVQVRPGGVHPSHCWITPAAIKARGPHTACVPVRGDELEQMEHQGYARIDPQMGERRRDGAKQNLMALGSALLDVRRSGEQEDAA